MSCPLPTDTTPIATADVETPVDAPKRKKTAAIPVKITRKLESLEAKNTKLVDEVKKLKLANAQLKSSHSRIRRIPKPAAAPAPAPAAEAE